MSAVAPPAPAPLPRRTLPWVGVGGAAGAALSLLVTHGLSTLVAWPPPHEALLASTAPLLPLTAVNLAGSFCLGLLRGRAERSGGAWDPRVLPAVGTGFLGSFTSFSGVTAAAAPLTVMTGVLAVTGDDWWVLIAIGLSMVLGFLAIMALLCTFAAMLGLRVGRGPAGPVRGKDSTVSLVDDVRPEAGT